MTEEIATTDDVGTLSDDEREIAAMVAGGMRTTDIAEAMGRLKQSISRSRNRPRVKAEIERLRAAAYERIQPLLQALAVSAVAGADEAVAVLRSHLDAKDSDGHPLYSVQQGAAEALLKFLSDAKDGTTDAGGGVGNLSGVIRLVIQNETGHEIEATAEDAEFDPVPPPAPEPPTEDG